jgi:hypothetical protein
MKKFIKSFFYSKGEPQPVYFWSTVFLTLTAIMIIFRLTAKVDAKLDLSDTLIIGMMGFVTALISIYTWFSTKDRRQQKPWNGIENRGKQIIEVAGSEVKDPSQVD